MEEQNYMYSNNYGGGQNNFGSDYPPPNNYRGGDRGNFNKGGKFGNNSGGFNKGSDAMEVQIDTVFVSGMNPETMESEIADHFGSIGIIKKDKRTQKLKIWIYKDKATGEGKGECTITYDDPHSASSAIEWFDGKEFNGSIIKVSLAQRNNSWQKSAPKKFGSAGGRGGSYGGNESRPPRSNFGGGSSGGQQREGDWQCSECQNKNFAWRNECNRCKAPKKNDAGGRNANPREGNFHNRDSNRNFNRGGMRGGQDKPSGSGGFNRQRPY